MSWSSCASVKCARCSNSHKSACVRLKLVSVRRTEPAIGCASFTCPARRTSNAGMYEGMLYGAASTHAHRHNTPACRSTRAPTAPEPTEEDVPEPVMEVEASEPTGIVAGAVPARVAGAPEPMVSLAIERDPPGTVALLDAEGTAERGEIWRAGMEGIEDAELDGRRDAAALMGRLACL